MTLTCLLIDDDPDDQEIFALALEDARVLCNYVTANSGIDALKILNDNEKLTPDFIFVDLNMSFLNGKQCLEEMKKITRLLRVPMIIYTTSSHERDIKETKELGASHYIVKPSSISLLSDILDRIFKRQSLPFLLNETILNS